MLSVSWDTIRLFLHVLAATIWVGGQLVLAALVPVLRRFGSEAVTAVARQFNRIAWSAFVVLVITGIWNITAISGTSSDTPSYRTTLMVKLAVVVLSGISAFVHIRTKTPRGRAIWGALTGLTALGALFLGVLLAG